MIRGLKEFALDTVGFNFRAFLFTLGILNLRQYIELKFETKFYFSLLSLLQTSRKLIFVHKMYYIFIFHMITGKYNMIRETSVNDIENEIILSSLKKHAGNKSVGIFSKHGVCSNDVDSQSRPLSKGTDRYRASADIRQEGERGERRLSESERERSRCIDRRHKIHFMTWTLSSDWCISRRIASQIKRSSTLEPPLTTSPGPRRRRTMPSTLVCISHPAFSLFIYTSHPLFRDTRQVYRQKLTS